MLNKFDQINLNDLASRFIENENGTDWHTAQLRIHAYLDENDIKFKNIAHKVNFSNMLIKKMKADDLISSDYIYIDKSK